MAPPNLTNPSIKVSCLRHSLVSPPSLASAAQPKPEPTQRAAPPLLHHPPHRPHRPRWHNVSSVCRADALPPPPRAPLWPGRAAVHVLLFVCSSVLLSFFRCCSLPFRLLAIVSCLRALFLVSFLVADMFALHLRAALHVGAAGNPPRRPRTACGVQRLLPCCATTLTPPPASAPRNLSLSLPNQHGTTNPCQVESARLLPRGGRHGAGGGSM